MPEFHAAWSQRPGLPGCPQQTPRAAFHAGRVEGDRPRPGRRRGGRSTSASSHVSLVSCKYLSKKILFNASPAHVFDALLAGRLSRHRSGAATSMTAACVESPGSCADPRGAGPGGDWYAEVAPAEYQALYEEVRRAVLERGAGRQVARRAVRPRVRASTGPVGSRRDVLRARPLFPASKTAAEAGGTRRLATR